MQQCDAVQVLQPIQANSYYCVFLNKFEFEQTNKPGGDLSEEAPQDLLFEELLLTLICFTDHCITKTPHIR